MCYCITKLLACGDSWNSSRIGRKRLLTKTSHYRVSTGGARSVQPDAPRSIEVCLLQNSRSIW